MKNLVLIIILTTALSVNAETFPAKVINTEYIFGNTRILRIIDATKDQINPDFRIDIYLGTELVGRYGGLYFEDIAASPNNMFFIGISNSGIPGTAIIIFNPSGRLAWTVDHGIHRELFNYCNVTSLERKWYDAENPDIRFIPKYEADDDVEIRGCDGTIIKIEELMR